MIIGQFHNMKPKANQKATPLAKTKYICSEMARVSLWRMMCKAWGTNAIVVRVAAMAETNSSIVALSKRATALRAT
jgi:hypothetical protein